MKGIFTNVSLACVSLFKVLIPENILRSYKLILFYQKVLGRFG